MDDADRDQVRTAIEVREDHRTGMCTECWGIGRCERYNTWFPIIAQLPPREATWPGDRQAWWI